MASTMAQSHACSTAVQGNATPLQACWLGAVREMAICVMRQTPAPLAYNGCSLLAAVQRRRPQPLFSSPMLQHRSQRITSAHATSVGRPCPCTPPAAHAHPPVTHEHQGCGLTRALAAQHTRPSNT